MRITRDEFLIEILDFILNTAEETELDAIHNAMQRRGRRAGVADLKFKDMAGQMVDQFKMEMPDFHGMTRDMVRNIILQHEPGIDGIQLETLLDHYAPNPNQPGSARTGGQSALPPDVLQDMLRQFISFSLGQMPVAEEKALRAQLPDWPERYWEQFSEETRQWVRGLIQESKGT